MKWTDVWLRSEDTMDEVEKPAKTTEAKDGNDSVGVGVRALGEEGRLVSLRLRCLDLESSLLEAAAPKFVAELCQLKARLAEVADLGEDGTGGGSGGGGGGRGGGDGDGSRSWEDGSNVSGDSGGGGGGGGGGEGGSSSADK